jgi:FAD synthase
MGIHVEYIEKELFDGEAISSSRIRKALDDGDINLVQKLIGRKTL